MVPKRSLEKIFGLWERRNVDVIVYWSFLDEVTGKRRNFHHLLTSMAIGFFHNFLGAIITKEELSLGTVLLEESARERKELIRALKRKVKEDQLGSPSLECPIFVKQESEDSVQLQEG
jgi:hypothetical protein